MKSTSATHSKTRGTGAGWFVLSNLKKFDAIYKTFKSGTTNSIKKSGGVAYKVQKPT